VASLFPGKVFTGEKAKDIQAVIERDDGDAFRNQRRICVARLRASAGKKASPVYPTMTGSLYLALLPWARRFEPASSSICIAYYSGNDPDQCQHIVDWSADLGSHLLAPSLVGLEAVASDQTDCVPLGIQRFSYDFFILGG
jgi:hypothetical protein